MEAQVFRRAQWVYTAVTTDEASARGDRCIGDDVYGEWDGVTCYVDDCAIYSKRKPGESEHSVMTRHAALLERFTQRLADRNTTLNIEEKKCILPEIY
jgi:hypothetical protein